MNITETHQLNQESFFHYFHLSSSIREYYQWLLNYLYTKPSPVALRWGMWWLFRVLCCGLGLCEGKRKWRFCPKKIIFEHLSLCFLLYSRLPLLLGISNLRSFNSKDCNLMIVLIDSKPLELIKTRFYKIVILWNSILRFWEIKSC